MPFQEQIGNFASDFSRLQVHPIPVQPQLGLLFQTHGNQVTFTWRTPPLPLVQSLHLITVSSKGHVEKFQVHKDANSQTFRNFIWGEKYSVAIFPEVGSTLEASEWITIEIGMYFLIIQFFYNVSGSLRNSHLSRYCFYNGLGPQPPTEILFVTQKDGSVRVNIKKVKNVPEYRFLLENSSGPSEYSLKNTKLNVTSWQTATLPPTKGQQRITVYSIAHGVECQNTYKPTIEVNTGNFLPDHERNNYGEGLF